MGRPFGLRPNHVVQVSAPTLGHVPLISFLALRIAIAIFKIHSAEIFATDSASSFYVLLTNLTSHLYSADRLLKVSACRVLSGLTSADLHLNGRPRSMT